MSLSSTTLDDFCQPDNTGTSEDTTPSLADQRAAVLEGGARYRHDPETREDAGDDLDVDTTTCKCGASVSSDYYRFHCGDDGVLHHCRHCTTATMMKQGAGAKPDIERRCPGTGDLGGGI